MAKKKRQGHYCKICGGHKANEKFSGKGHAKHICKTCDSLPQEKKNELQYINRIERIAGKYPRSREDWDLLEKYAKSSKYPEAREFAQSILEWGKPDIEQTGDSLFENVDIDYLPLFSEKKKFSELDGDEKMLLKDYIYSEIIDRREHSGKILDENELIEIKKRMIIFLEEEHNISLKNDATLRQFVQDNTASIINKLSKKRRIANE